MAEPGVKSRKLGARSHTFTTALGLTPSGREMEDELTLIQKVISSGGSCMSQDMELGNIKGLFSYGDVERKV